jgi:hypothetical protein
MNATPNLRVGQYFSVTDKHFNPVFRLLICVLKSNGLVFKWHLNTGQTCPVSKWSIGLVYVLWSKNRSGLRIVKNKMDNFTI